MGKGYADFCPRARRAGQSLDLLAHLVGAGDHMIRKSRGLLQTAKALASPPAMIGRSYHGGAENRDRFRALSL
jgi:hypothetical protein